MDIFRLCTHNLVGAYYLHPPPQMHVSYFYIIIYYVMARAL